MTELDAAALDFARECLGWPEVEAYAVDYRKRVVRNLAVAGDCWTVFYASDLNTVMEKVREWCDGQSLRLGVSREPPDPMWSASVGYAHQSPFCGCLHPDLRVAVMAACVAAARKVKGSGA